MMRLYDYLVSGAGHNVRLLRTQLGIPFRVETQPNHIPISDPRNSPAWPMSDDPMLAAALS
jgi:hypothetical protein